MESEESESLKKVTKYKRIAKQFKTNLDSIEQTLVSLKKLSQEEIKSLKENVSFLEKTLKTKSVQYTTNLKTICNYLTRIQKMISPSD